ncbi:MAG: hypothetical protein GXP21_03800 [Gammaproteobacteria bacterium]|nr:hypothetical protein [Gammaproteobacteria bacterium]
MNNLSQHQYLVALFVFATAGVGAVGKWRIYSACEVILLINEGDDDGLEQEDGICRP